MKLPVLLLCVISCIACSKLKTVDTSLHERRNGNMGFGLEYAVFRWRFGNQTRVVARREEVECLWQATIRSARPDSVSIEIGFRLFDVNGETVDEISYGSRKISYPDTIADFIIIGPGDTSQSVSGTFWVERDFALRAAEGDIFIIDSRPHYVPGPETVVFDSTFSARDSLNLVEDDSL